MKRFADIVRGIVGTGTAIGNCALIGVMLLVVASIVGRLVGHTIVGSYELIEIIIVVGIAFFLVYGAISHSHVVVRVVVSRFPQRAQDILTSFNSVLSIGTLALMAWAGAQLMHERVLLGEETELLGVPSFPFRGVWVFALVLFCLVILIELFKALSQAVKK